MTRRLCRIKGGMGMSSFAMTRAIRSSALQNTRRSARPSTGVFWRLQIARNGLRLRPGIVGISLAGVTVSEEPRTRNTSDFSACSYARLKSASGRSSPKLMMLSSRVPPQIVHLRRVRWSCAGASSGAVARKSGRTGRSQSALGTRQG